MTTDPTKLSIKYLFGSMTVGQAWTFGATIFGLLVGSFAAGYSFSESLQVRSEHVLDSLENEVKISAETNRFLALYLRFMMAKDQLDPEIHDEDARENYRTTRDALDKFASQRIDAESLILGKGGGRLATIRLNDGTTWELPAELHIVSED